MEELDDKLAAFSLGNALKGESLLGKVITSLLSGIALGTAFQGVDELITYFKRRNIKAKSKEYYQKMIDSNPQLKDFSVEEIGKYWESLYHFAPHMAQDPLAAGAFITQALRRLSTSELGGPPPDTFATLTDIQKKFKEGRPEDKANKFTQAVQKNLYGDLHKELRPELESWLFPSTPREIDPLNYGTARIV